MKTIKIKNTCLELSREGFKDGSIVKAEIDKQGKAWFGRCVVYPGNYSIV